MPRGHDAIRTSSSLVREYTSPSQPMSSASARSVSPEVPTELFGLPLRHRRPMKVLARVAEDAASWKMSAQNRSELAESEDVSDINSSVRDAAGLDVHVVGGTPQKCAPTEIPMHGQRSASPSDSNKKPRAAQSPPVVEIGSVGDFGLKNGFYILRRSMSELIRRGR